MQICCRAACTGLSCRSCCCLHVSGGETGLQFGGKATEAPRNGSFFPAVGLHVRSPFRSQLFIPHQSGSWIAHQRVLLILEWCAPAAEAQEVCFRFRSLSSTGASAKSKELPEEMDDLEIFASAALQGRRLLFLRRMGG